MFVNLSLRRLCNDQHIDYGRSYSYGDGTHSINDCFFSRMNPFSGDGGVIYYYNISPPSVYTSLGIYDSMFFNCTVGASYHAGAIKFICFVNSQCEFQRVCANSCGAGLTSQFAEIGTTSNGDSMKFDYLSIVSCQYDGLSGALHLTFSNQDVKRTNFSQNKAQTDSALSTFAPHNFHCSFCSFVNNHPTVGTCIRLSCDSGSLEFNNIIGNDSPINGYGVIHTHNGTYSMNYCVFRDNKDCLFYAYNQDNSQITISNSYIDHLDVTTFGSIDLSLNNSYGSCSPYEISHFESYYCPYIPTIAPTLEPSCTPQPCMNSNINIGRSYTGELVSFHIEDCSFVRYQVFGDNGGVINIVNSAISTTDSILIGKSMFYTIHILGNGGAIYCSLASQSTITLTKICANDCSSSGSGNFLYINNGQQIQIDTSYLIQSAKTLDNFGQSVIYSESFNSNQVISTVNISGNFSPQNSALYINSLDFLLEFSLIGYNSASFQNIIQINCNSGNTRYTNVIENSVPNNNIIYCPIGIISFSNCIFHMNEGILFSSFFSTINIQDCVIDHIGLTSTGTVNFLENVSTGFQGTLNQEFHTSFFCPYIPTPIPSLHPSCTPNPCISESMQVGQSYDQIALLFISNCVFIRSQPYEGNGGVISYTNMNSENSLLKIEDSMFYNCQVTQNGGAIYYSSFVNEQTIDLRKICVSSCKANFGGFIYAISPFPSFTDISIVQGNCNDQFYLSNGDGKIANTNASSNIGGVIVSQTTNEFQLTYSTIINNNCNNFALAILKGSIENSNIISNSLSSHINTGIINLYGDFAKTFTTIYCNSNTQTLIHSSGISHHTLSLSQISHSDRIFTHEGSSSLTIINSEISDNSNTESITLQFIYPIISHKPNTLSHFSSFYSNFNPQDIETPPRSFDNNCVYSRNTKFSTVQVIFTFMIL